MAIKARAGLPLTFAVKDITLDLRTHVDLIGSEVRIRPAGPGDKEASMLHLALTTITRPMIEENTPALATEEALVEGGARRQARPRRSGGSNGPASTASQLRELQRQTGTDVIGRVSQLAGRRLRAALAAAAEPNISHVVAAPDRSGSAGGSAAADPGRNLATAASRRCTSADGRRRCCRRATRSSSSAAAARRAGTVERANRA